MGGFKKSDLLKKTEPENKNLIVYRKHFCADQNFVNFHLYEGCSEIIETSAVNKLRKKLQILILVVR